MKLFLNAQKHSIYLYLLTAIWNKCLILYLIWKILLWYADNPENAGYSRSQSGDLEETQEWPEQYDYNKQETLAKQTEDLQHQIAETLAKCNQYPIMSGFTDQLLDCKMCAYLGISASGTSD